MRFIGPALSYKYSYSLQSKDPWLGVKNLRQRLMSHDGQLISENDKEVVIKSSYANFTGGFSLLPSTILIHLKTGIEADQIQVEVEKIGERKRIIWILILFLLIWGFLLFRHRNGASFLVPPLGFIIFWVATLMPTHPGVLKLREVLAFPDKE